MKKRIKIIGAVLGSVFLILAVVIVILHIQVNARLQQPGNPDVAEAEAITVAEVSAPSAPPEMADDKATQAEPVKSAPPAPIKRTGIQVSFKLDPRLTKSLYMGDRWVSQATYTRVQENGKDCVLEARADVLDAEGKPTKISPEWTAEDPGMLTVSRPQGQNIEIIVQRPGKTTLVVAANGISRQLSVTADYYFGGLLKAEIVQQ